MTPSTNRTKRDRGKPNHVNAEGIHDDSMSSKITAFTACLFPPAMARVHAKPPEFRYVAMYLFFFFSSLLFATMMINGAFCCSGSDFPLCPLARIIQFWGSASTRLLPLQSLPSIYRSGLNTVRLCPVAPTGPLGPLVLFSSVPYFANLWILASIGLVCLFFLALAHDDRPRIRTMQQQIHQGRWCI
ncbi:hypothetical protein LZ30DRAFT_321309 [Colletotrichum cereale]|nr:hypothetical protein LZ30DRAFT_321309 [Colletotrichum cereale]